MLCMKPSIVALKCRTLNRQLVTRLIYISMMSFNELVLFIFCLSFAIQTNSAERETSSDSFSANWTPLLANSPASSVDGPQLLLSPLHVSLLLFPFAFVVFPALVIYFSVTRKVALPGSSVMSHADANGF